MHRSRVIISAFAAGFALVVMVLVLISALNARPTQDEITKQRVTALVAADKIACTRYNALVEQHNALVLQEVHITRVIRANLRVDATTDSDPAARREYAANAEMLDSVHPQPVARRDCNDLSRAVRSQVEKK